MKKLLALCLVMTMALSGCAVLTTAKNLLCNPTAVQIEQAKLAVQFIDQTVAILGGPLPVGWALAKQIFLQVRPGFCVGLDQLAAAIKAFDDARNITVAMVKAKPGLKPVIVPNIDSLRKAISP